MTSSKKIPAIAVEYDGNELQLTDSNALDISVFRSEIENENPVEITAVEASRNDLAKFFSADKIEVIQARVDEKARQRAKVEAIRARAAQQEQYR